jgi:signal transduction histidine kinase
MARRIQAYQRGMHDYIAAMTQGQEEERRRLARELHDDTVQSLIVLNHRVEKAQKLLSKDPDSAARPLAEVRVSLAAAIEGVRRFSRDLRPIYLEDLGFIPALEVLAREADGQDGPSVRFSLEGHVRRLSPDMELAAYRIVQEAINNVLKHAQATEAHVSVGFEPGYLRLTVRDNGRGFVPPDVPDLFAHRGHFGLMGMQERALLYGGRLSIDSAPGSGTDVSVRLPYSDVGDDSP